MMRSEHITKADASESSSSKENEHHQACCLSQEEVSSHSTQEAVDTSTIPFELYKRLTTVVVTRENFLNVACDALSVYKYVGPNQRADLLLACR